MHQYNLKFIFGLVYFSDGHVRLSRFSPQFQVVSGQSSYEELCNKFAAYVANVVGNEALVVSDTGGVKDSDLLVGLIEKLGVEVVRNGKKATVSEIESQDSNTKSK